MGGLSESWEGGRTVSKFKGLLDTAKSRELGAEPFGFESTHRRSKGRPPGERTNPQFVQITAYTRRETHRRVKMALLEKGCQEFSELVEELLLKWIASST
jgi:hypothetical protein